MTEDEQRFCRRCGYSLTHLPETRCPECGQTFDPQDPRSFRTGPRPWWSDWTPIAGFLCWVPLATVGWYGCHRGRALSDFRHPVRLDVLFWIAAVVTLVFVSLGIWRGKRLSWVMLVLWLVVVAVEVLRPTLS